MNRSFVLGRKEIREAFFSKTAALFLVLVSFILGYGFATAVRLYSEQSLAAVGNLLYARGFEPVPGVFGPTCGGLFLLFSLVLPFVAIQRVGLEREHNTLAILAQLPFSFRAILAAKIAACFLFVLFALGLTLPGVIAWRIYGGHIPYRELALLLSGYLLYGLFVVSVSFFSAALFRSSANASIVAIALIVSSWLIDFGSNMSGSTLLTSVSGWTVTRMLKYFENGIFSLAAVLYFAGISALFFAGSHILLRFDLKNKWKYMVATAMLFVLFMSATVRITYNVDVTESGRNSFPSSISQALRKLPDLEIEVYLRPGDSRFEDYRRSFLKKLHLVLNDVKVKMMTGAALDKHYGLFVYKVDGETGKTYSNSEEEILPILFGLAGIKVDRGGGKERFPGYPLVVKGNMSIVRYLYYFMIPLGMALVLVIRNYQFRRRIQP